MKDFGQKVETVVSIVGSYIEHNIKDREKFDRQLKGIFETGEKVLKTTIQTAMSSDFVKSNMTVDAEYQDEVEDINLEPVHRSVRMKVKKLEHFQGDLPKYESKLAAGFDVRAQIEEEIALKPGERNLIPTGLSFEIPEGYEVQARPRSGLAIKQGVSLVNSPGTIDADYRGEVKIILINQGQEDIVIKPQDRIAQLVLAPVYQALFEEVVELSDTERGEGGFGSTGV